MHAFVTTYRPPLSTVRHERHLTLRTFRPRDAALLIDLFSRLSARTRYLRYWTARSLAGDDARREADRLDRAARAGAVVLIASRPAGWHEEAVGLAEVALDPRERGAGELAILVRDDQQRRGVGGRLGRKALELARERGVVTLRCHLLPENRAALGLIRSLGAPYRMSRGHGELQVEIAL